MRLGMTEHLNTGSFHMKELSKGLSSYQALMQKSSSKRSFLSSSSPVMGRDDGSSYRHETEVDYDLNPTELYLRICDSDWDASLTALEDNPVESKIWVVKSVGDGQATCRFLPIHSACARQPPVSIICALLEAFPEGVNARDDNGMYPLHYASANHASVEVIAVLLSAFPDANQLRVEADGALPIHLAAQWGVSSLSVIDELLADNPSLACARDNDGHISLDLAHQSEGYSCRQQVIKRLSDVVDEQENAASINDSSTITSANGATRSAGNSMPGDSIEEDEDNHANAIHASVSRMEVEIETLRNHIRFVEARAEEQLAHEWGSIRDFVEETEGQISNLIRPHQKLVRNFSNSHMSHHSSRTPRRQRSSGSLAASGRRGRLGGIEAENQELEAELEKQKHVLELYKTKKGATENIMKELEATLKTLVKEQKSSLVRVQAMQGNLQVISAVRQTKLQAMMTDEKMYSRNIAREDKVSQVRKSETEKLLSKEKMLLKMFKSIRKKD